MTRPAIGRAQVWRYGALALFCGVPVLLAALAIGNLAEASAARDLEARQRATLSQIVAQVAKHKSHGLTAQDKASLFLASNSPSLARAELQEKTGRLVQEAGGKLAEAQFTSTPEQEADGTVAIQLSLDVDNKGLFDLLYAVETATPLLEASDMTARPVAVDKAEGAAPSGLLHVDLTVQGQFKRSDG